MIIGWSFRSPKSGFHLENVDLYLGINSSFKKTQTLGGFRISLSHDKKV